MNAKSLGGLLPSIPYPPAGWGYCSPVTSTLNWCEEDYYATIYSAEIVNTLTNLLFVVLAFKGFYNCLNNGHDRIFLVTFTGYMCVGLGSLLFHSTLKYPMQLVDELSMIYTTCFSCYVSFSYSRSRLIALCIALFLFSTAIFITAYYHYLQDPSFHQNAYALLTATVLFRGMYVMEFILRPRIKQRKKLHEKQQDKGEVDSAERREQMRRDRRDERILSQMWTMIAYGLGIFLLGYAIWNVDNKYCSTLRRWRREVGLPWGILLEGHGWWHLMTGVGAYFYIMWGIWLRHCLNGKQDQYELYWPNLVFSVPAVVLKRPKIFPRVSSSNGIAKKSI